MSKSKEKTVWSWEEGAVDAKKEHIRIYRANDPKPSARVAPGRDRSFTVQFIKRSGVPKKVLEGVRRELDYYLVELGEENPWAYAIYHCSTMANVYSTVQWGYYSPKRRVEAGKAGVALTHFNTKSVAAMPVPLPSLAEQKQIVAEVERRLSVIDELEATVESNLKRAERTRQAILQRAFEGQLIPSEGNRHANDRYTMPIAAESPALYRTHR